MISKKGLTGNAVLDTVLWILFFILGILAVYALAKKLGLR